MKTFSPLAVEEELHTRFSARCAEHRHAKSQVLRALVELYASGKIDAAVEGVLRR